MNTDQYFEIKSERDESLNKDFGYIIDIIPDKRDYMDEHVYFWFTDKEKLFSWVRIISKYEKVPGTKDNPRFGGNFIDVEPDLFEKFIKWIWDDAKRVAIAGWTGNVNRPDLTIDEIIIDPKDGITTKSIRRKGHVSKADEVSDTDEGYVRCWWD